MVRPIAQTAPHKGEVFDTPMEELLRGRSIFVPEPLDLPTDRDWPLEDILYAAGSAFARPSQALEDYYVTARKREADAPAEQPEMPDEVTKPEEAQKQKPEGIADTEDFGYEFPMLSRLAKAQKGKDLPPVPKNPLADEDKYRAAITDRNNFTKNLKTPIPQNLMGKIGRSFGTEEEALQALVDNVQQLTLSDTERDKQEYGAVIRKRTNPDGSVSYYHDQIYRGRGGSDVSIGIQAYADKISKKSWLAGDPIVAVFHTHPLASMSQMMGIDHEALDKDNAEGYTKNDRLNQQLSYGDRGNGNAMDPNNESMLAQIQRLSISAGHTNPINAYLAGPDGQIRKWSGNWSGTGTQVMPSYNFDYVREKR